MKMLISMIASKLNFKNTTKKARLKKKRASLEAAYGKPLEEYKTNEEMNAWLMQVDPYMAELFEE
ncbi:MAG: hypothetical protein J6K85_03455 [Clostridia bacterium]|nr:hypothetical protein [Clostridia bacterium]